MAFLSGAEVKVMLYIFRRTLGFKRYADNISLNQLLNGIVRRDGTRLDHGTGLSKSTLLNCHQDAGGEESDFSRTAPK